MLDKMTYNRIYYERNRKKILKRMRKWWKLNKWWKTAYQREYRKSKPRKFKDINKRMWKGWYSKKKNRRHKTEYDKTYRRVNKTWIKEHKKTYYLKNRKKFIKMGKKSYLRSKSWKGKLKRIFGV